MNEIDVMISPPAMTATKLAVSEATAKMWKDAVWTVKAAAKKFRRAYEATLDDLLGAGWREKWKDDPAFYGKLSDAEGVMREMCSGIPLRAWNRYRTAARKSVLLGVRFELGSGFTVHQIREAAAAAKGDEAKMTEILTEVREDARARRAAQVVARHATVLPLPQDQQHADDYLADVGSRLADHLGAVTAAYGVQAAHDLIRRLVSSLEAR